MADAVGRCHVDNRCDRFAIVEASVAAYHQTGAGFQLQRIENRLYKVFEIVRLLKNLNLFAQPCSAGSLIAKRADSHFPDIKLHNLFPVFCEPRGG